MPRVFQREAFEDVVQMVAVDLLPALEVIDLLGR